MGDPIFWRDVPLHKERVPSERPFQVLLLSPGVQISQKKAMLMVSVLFG